MADLTEPPRVGAERQLRNQDTYRLPVSNNEQVFREVQAAQVADADTGTAHPGEHREG
jgi:hypothetical protein